jgi:hypothetical protein
LELLAPRGWYIGDDGVTRIGTRAASTYNGTAPRERTDLARGIIVVASDTIKTLVPGVSVDGLTAVDVQHEVTKKGLRTTIYGASMAAAGRLGALQDLMRALLPRLDYMVPVEYRVESLAGNRLTLQPVRTSSGMPELARVPVRPGIAGALCKPALGSRVLVSFVEANPAFPYVCAFEEADAAGFAPTDTTIEVSAILQLGDATAVALAKQLPTSTALTAIQVYIAAVTAAASANPALYPGFATAMAAPGAAAAAALSAQIPLIPTVKAKGT